MNPDWQKIVLDLRGMFGSCRQMARVMHYGNPDYLTKLGRAEIADPPYSVGYRLIELYEKHIGEALPMIGGWQQKKLNV